MRMSIKVVPLICHTADEKSHVAQTQAHGSFPPKPMASASDWLVFASYKKRNWFRQQDNLNSGLFVARQQKKNGGVPWKT